MEKHSQMIMTDALAVKFLPYPQAGRFLAAGLAIVSCLFLGLLAAGETFAQGDPYGLKTTADNAGIETDKNVPAIVGNVVGTGLSMISVLFFGLMIYAGLKWMISRGSEDEAKKALDTMIAAAIGIIIVMASYALTTFVFKSVGSGGGGGGGGGAGAAKPSGSPIASSGKCVLNDFITDSCSGATVDNDGKCPGACQAINNKCVPALSATDCSKLTESACQAAAAKAACSWST